MKFATRPTPGQRHTGRRYWQSGFTFAEVLAALVFMAIVIPVAIEGLRIASRAGIVAERKGVAVQLGDRMLNELIVTGRWKESSQSGNFGTDWSGFRWTLRNQPWQQAAMRLLTIEVVFAVQNQDYNVELSTLVSDSQ